MSIAWSGVAQITVNDSAFSTEQLVEDVLINSPCAQVSNISSFTGTAAGFNGIGYFESNGSDFPIDKGVILSTGNATSAEGPNGTVPLSEGLGFDWTGDTDLSNITGTTNLFNASYIQFDFIPTVDFISFDFLFASEEYFESFPCTFSDVFAFILTDSSGNSTNLAVIPGTDPPIPISVTTINEGVDINGDRDFTDAGECPPQNESFYNSTIPPGTNSSIDFNGLTKVLTASGSVNVGETYTIKLVIADNSDQAFDSAVFLAGGSFNLGGDLGEDRTLVSGNPGCIGDPIILDATLGTNSTYIWMRDGLPLVPGDGTSLLAGGSQLEVTQGGTYSVEVTIASGCTSTDTIEIEFITAPTIANSPNTLLSCDTDDDGFSPFDLTLNTNVVLGGQDPALFQVTYHLTQTDAQNYTGAASDNLIETPGNFTNTVANQVIWVRIAETNQKCFDIESFVLEVIKNPIANDTADYELCDNRNDGDDVNGAVIFDLSTKITEVLGTQDASLYTVLFYDDQTTAHNGVTGTELPTVLTNTSNPQTIFARIENNTNRQCYEITTFQLVVNALPIVEDVVSLLQCDNDIDGFSRFNLSEANSLISTNSSNETFTYYLTAQQAINGGSIGQITDFTTFPNPNAVNSVVYARVESDKGCVRTSQIDLQVSTTQIPSDFNLVYTICESDVMDDNPSDGIATFNFSDATNQISQLYPTGQNLIIAYYQNEADALAEENEITDISNYRNTASPFLQELYVRVEDGTNNSCLGLGRHITLQVNPFEPIEFQDEYVICLLENGTAINLLPDDVIDTQLDDTIYNFQWYVGEVPLAGNEIPGETDATYIPSISGVYSVLVTGIATGCTLSKSTTVIESYPPQNITAELLSGAFSDNAVIEVTAEPIGEYEYRLDEGNWQDSNVFTNVSRGEHTAYVRDKKLCGELSVVLEPFVDYPSYFTPNGDGINDSWNISGSDSVVIRSIRIFDRYGKLLKDLGPSSTWDGTYNGRLLPSSEYWFAVSYLEENIQKDFRASFSLIR
ncbi:hypothetical protein GCM10009430_47950 [Aquimarina litoralis]|uniref:Gliding motility-associated C-terminal domain-containing protein n=1 Tax=Aquimarina litoralis TaxID=584605 RepID=A0ABN1JAG3_9FLAO